MDKSNSSDSNFGSSNHFLPIVPVLTREKFAEATGLPLGVVSGMVNKGILPTVKLGKWAPINVELLRQRCLAKEFE